ncbi:MAG: hypothetical protein Q9227_004812 [Pyrenula ochraceoflavens]
MASLLLNSISKISQWGGEVTNVDKHSCKRVVPMKVLVLGLSRTAIRQALRDIGYRDVYHASVIYGENPADVDMWIEAFEGKFDGTRKRFGRNEWDQLLGNCMAVTDVPCVPHFDEDLMEAYPEAKVILSVRDSAEQWWKSVSTTLVPFSEWHEHRGRLGDKLWRFFMPHLRFDEYHQQLLKRGSIQDVRKRGKQQYTNHNARIKKLCAEQGRPCLEFNVKDGYAPLCEYLEEPVPIDPGTGKPAQFPRRNDSIAFQKTDRSLRVFMRLLVAINVACFVAGTTGLIVGFEYVRRKGFFGLPVRQI